MKTHIEYDDFGEYIEELDSLEGNLPLSERQEQQQKQYGMKAG